MSSNRTSQEAGGEEEEDPFTSLLHLEEKYHAEGYALGVEDGARAGRIEGRTFGLEKGFEKFSALGQLGGRSAVWSARLESLQNSGGQGVLQLPPLKESERLRRQVERLCEVADRESLSTVNDEEGVNAFDDRLREANAKARLVGRMVGEREDLSAVEDAAPGTAKAGKQGNGGGEMEDFAGLRVPAAKRSGDVMGERRAFI